MRQRAELPKYVCFRVKNGDASMAVLCICGEAAVRESFVHLDESGSSAEYTCPKCRRMVQVRCSRLV